VYKSCASRGGYGYTRTRQQVRQGPAFGKSSKNKKLSALCSVSSPEQKQLVGGTVVVYMTGGAVVVARLGRCG